MWLQKRTYGFKIDKEAPKQYLSKGESVCPKKTIKHFGMKYKKNIYWKKYSIHLNTFPQVKCVYILN
jgi:oligoendopeptidase F